MHSHSTCDEFGEPQVLELARRSQLSHIRLRILLVPIVKEARGRHVRKESGQHEHEAMGREGEDGFHASARGPVHRNASVIARSLASKKVSPKGPASGMRMLTYFINRAGRGLTAARRAKLERAKSLLSKRVQQANRLATGGRKRLRQSRTHWGMTALRNVNSKIYRNDCIPLIHPMVHHSFHTLTSSPKMEPVMKQCSGPDGTSWRDLYRAALLESRGAEIPQRIAAAEAEIVKRARMLFGAPGGSSDEAEALDRALYMLRALKSCLKCDSGDRLAA